MSSHLERLAKRVENDPFFLGCLLKQYARSEAIDDVATAKSLGCTPETLTMLRLCRAPDVSRLKEDVDEIASKFEVDRTALLLAIRRGQVVLKLRESRAGTPGTLLAARDREPDDGGES